MSSEALKPEPVTELPLTPPAEDDDEDAAITSTNWKTDINKPQRDTLILEPQQQRLHLPPNLTELEETHSSLYPKQRGNTVNKCSF